MAAAPKLLVLALDAASPFLLRSWAAEGVLPNIAELIRTGLVGETRGVEGLYHGATWPSFWTGRNPAGHGVYWFDRLIPGTYRTQRCRSADFRRSQSLWDALSDAGRRVVVMDVPFLRPSARRNGIHIAEWGAHDIDLGFATRPRRLKGSILRREGAHPAPRACDSPGRSPAEYREFTDQLCRGAATRAALTRRMLAQQPWDFAIQVFGESHCAGHQLWHFHDPMHPAFDAASAAEAGDPVRRVYIAIDRAIGEIVSGCDAGTTVVLLDLHGMSYYCGASFLLPDMLTRLGVLHRLSREPAESATGPADAGLRQRFKAAYHRLPEWLRAPVYDVRQYLNQRWLGRGSPMDIDPRRSQCFEFGFGATFAGIRLNLAGREPLGQLAPGEEAERFCESLTRDLLAINCLETGHPVVRRVLRTADLHSGPFLAELPDLLIEWSTERALGSAVVGTGAGATLRLSSPRLGVLEGVNVYSRTGDHRIEGLFVARGPGLTPGHLNRVVSNLDLAPTFARFLGSELPVAEGIPIPELLRSQGTRETGSERQA